MSALVTIPRHSMFLSLMDPTTENGIVPHNITEGELKLLFSVKQYLSESYRWYSSVRYQF